MRILEPLAVAPQAGWAAASPSQPQGLAASKDQFERTPDMPAYHVLAPELRREAELRCEGTTYPQRPITNETGEPHEPINLVMTGTRSEITAALTAAGWTHTDEIGTFSGLKTIGTVLDGVTPLHHLKDFEYAASPVSDMFLGGKRYDLAFNKNNEHNLARDHLRLYDTGRQDASGRSIWEVAATRDTGLQVDLRQRKGGHVIDTHVDRERDQVMADLLEGGTVQNWGLARGVMAPSDAIATQLHYQTDGQLYLVELKPRPELPPDLGQKPDPEDQLIGRAPKVLQGPLHRIDQALTRFFRSWT